VIRGLVLGVLAALIASVAALPAIAEPVTYARFVVDGETKVGEVRGDRVLEIKGGLFGAREISDRTHKTRRCDAPGAGGAWQNLRGGAELSQPRGHVGRG